MQKQMQSMHITHTLVCCLYLKYRFGEWTDCDRSSSVFGVIGNDVDDEIDGHLAPKYDA